MSHTGTYRFPTIPGHEFAGEIVATGANLTAWTAGDRILAAPLIPCGQCGNCLKGWYGQCGDYDFIGSRWNGAFAEYVAVPAANLILLPDTIPFEQGAMVEPAAVTLHGLYKTQITKEDSVAVLGVGAIGILAVALAKILGAAQVLAVDIADDKLEMAKRYGADILINSNQEDAVAAVGRLTNGQGVSVVVEAAGNAVTQEQALCVAKAHGRVLLLGTAHHNVTLPPTTFEGILRRELVLYGSWNSYSAPFPGSAWRDLVGYLSNGLLDLSPMITRTISLEELPENIQAMNARTLPYNKVLVKFE